MDGDKASRFVSSLVKSIQALCNGYIDFSTSIEVVGHIHLNIDRSVKLDYVLTEEVSKSISEGATVFASHSYHSHPPPSLSCNKSASDGSSRNRQKQSSSVSHGDEEDSSSFRSLGSDLHNTSIKSDNHSHKRSSESFADSGDSVKQENTQKSCVAQKPSERLRRNMPFPSHPHRSPPPVAKRSRQSDYNNPDLNPQEYEVIEIKEEPDDEPAVFFGNSSADGQDLQTPNFSSVVMESLDRVGKMEGTDLMGGEGGAMQHQQQQPPFPVMMHSNSGMPSSSSSGQGPSLSDPQDQSFASTSGMGQSYDERGSSQLGQHLHNSHLPNSLKPGYPEASFYRSMQHRFHKVRNPQSTYWRNMSEERRALEREKSRLRMQASRARRKERERLMAEVGRTVSPYT